MERLRIAVGLIAVAVGAAWLLGGEAALHSGRRWLLTALPYVLIALGALLILRAALPRGLLAGPLALIAGGGLWAAYDLGYVGGEVGDKLWPALLIAAGAGLALAGGGHPARADEAVPLRRYRSVLLPVRRTVLPGQVGLVKVGVGSFFGDARIDLSSARFAADPRTTDGQVLRVDVTVLFGRVELVVDSGCVVVKGNVENSPAVHFAERVRVHQEPPEGAPRRVVLNVLGVGGAVGVRAL